MYTVCGETSDNSGTHLKGIINFVISIKISFNYNIIIKISIFIVSCIFNFTENKNIFFYSIIFTAY